GACSSGASRRSADAQSSASRLALERWLVLHAVIAGEPADQRGALPVLQDAAQVFPRDAGERSKVALAQLLAGQDAARAGVLAEGVRQHEQGTCGAPFDR